MLRRSRITCKPTMVHRMRCNSRKLQSAAAMLLASSHRLEASVDDRRMASRFSRRLWGSHLPSGSLDKSNVRERSNCSKSLSVTTIYPSVSIQQIGEPINIYLGSAGAKAATVFLLFLETPICLNKSYSSQKYHTIRQFCTTKACQIGDRSLGGITIMVGI